MFFESPDSYDSWLNTRYVERLRQTHGDEDSRQILTDEQVAREVQEAMDDDIFLNDGIGGEG